MCIAVYLPKGKKLSKEKFFQCHDSNPDGFGLMFARNGKILIHKTLESAESAYADYKRISKGPAKGQNMVLHFRIATHGSVNKENCHPFRIDERLALVHNGIIHAVDTHKYKDMSDTRVFAKEILAKLPLFFEWEDSIKRLIEEFIGHSKLIILDDEGMAHIFNEHKGEWVDGMWFSNNSHCPVPAPFKLPAKFRSHAPLSKAEKKALRRPSKQSAQKPGPVKNVTKAYKTANYRTTQKNFWTAEDEK
tara:strand:+ start:1427 stop:2170 length:744 start_codon:yes stop_codon:yes gene_type:complete